ncbi:MAG: phosphoribosyl-ATP diphosphatase [Solirubrobacteraceae bacterium]
MEDKDKSSLDFLNKLEEIIKLRKQENATNSYVASLFKEGKNKIAQKVGEEAVELVIETFNNDNDLFLNEAADLLFHYLILLNYKNFELNDVINILKERHSTTKK